MTLLVDALERLALPIIVALFGSGGGLVAYLKYQQSRKPWRDLEARYEAAEQAIEAKFHAEMATRESEWKSQFRSLERQMAALTEKVEYLEGENQKWAHRVGLLEGVLHEHSIPLPE